LLHKIGADCNPKHPSPGLWPTSPTRGEVKSMRK
jgi:hypothetical protein